MSSSSFLPILIKDQGSYRLACMVWSFKQPSSSSVWDPCSWCLPYSVKVWKHWSPSFISLFPHFLYLVPPSLSFFLSAGMVAFLPEAIVQVKAWRNEWLVQPLLGTLDTRRKEKVVIILLLSQPPNGYFWDFSVKPFQLK